MPELHRTQPSWLPQGLSRPQEDERSDQEPRSSKLMERSVHAQSGASRSGEPGWQVQEELEIGVQLHS